jgi:hypothetical protein
MIQFGAASLFVIDASGNEQSYDLDALQDRLSVAFQQQGIQESWLAENLVLTLEEKIRSSNENGVRLSEQELEQILVNVLVATGYREVATEYLRINLREVMLLPEGMRGWDVESLRRMLASSLPLSYGQLEDLSRDSLRALQRLGFGEVSETFMRELAIHVLHYRKTSEELKQLRPAARKTQFITADAWLDVASEKARELIEQQILLPLPLSDIFPAARVEFNLQAFACWKGEWSPELALLPALPELSLEVVALLGRMRKYIIQNWPRISNPSAHLILPDFQQYFLREIPNLKKKQRLALRDMVKEELEKQVLPRTDYELLLSFR